MDRYLFRGKLLDNGEWVTGFYHVVTKGAHLSPIENSHCVTTYKVLKNGEIILTGCHDVEPATVGQCTGLHDKNGKLIYEGDIVKLHYGTGLENKISRVTYQDLRWVLADIKNDDYYATYDFELLGSYKGTGMEIIGNIHDNPELVS